MPYNTLGLLVSLGILGTFLLVGDASVRTKLLLAALFAGSALLQAHSPRWELAGFLVQMLVAIGIAIHLKWKR